MKKILCFFWLLFFITVLSTKNAVAHKLQVFVMNSAYHEENDAVKVVSHFLTWYNKNYKQLKAIKLVPQNLGNGKEQYRVDFAAVDIYLKILKSSSSLSTFYLNNLRKYLESCDKKMILKKQTEGPPAGLEADLVLKTQEIKASLAMIGKSNLNLEVKKQENELITVHVKLPYVLKFSLKKERGKWIIEQISPIS